MLEYLDQSSRSLGVAGIRAKSGLTGSEAIPCPNLQDPLLDVLQPPPTKLNDVGVWIEGLRSKAAISGLSDLGGKSRNETFRLPMSARRNRSAAACVFCRQKKVRDYVPM